MNTKKIVYKGGKVLTERGFENIDIEISQGKISALAPCIAGESIDIEGCFVSPGFVDIHVHGGGGFDFMDGGSDAIIGACSMHAHHGTTSILPTALTAPDDEIISFIESVRETRTKKWLGAKIEGVHLEGPWFNPEKAGAQPPEFLKNPIIEQWSKFFKAADDNGVRIAIITAAPELNGAHELAAAGKSRGILMSMGHSAATISQVRGAKLSGFSHMAHFYSAMSGITRVNGFRVAGMVEAGYLYDDISVEVIGDGCHLPIEIVALIHKVKGVHRMALITDAMRAAGMPEGCEYILGSAKSGQAAIAEDGVAKLKDKGGVFAGSTCTMDRAIRTCAAAGIPLEDALRMASETPAKLVGIDYKCGKIALGRNADIVILDQKLNIVKTIIEGSEAA